MGSKKGQAGRAGMANKRPAAAVAGEAAHKRPAAAGLAAEESGAEGDCSAEDPQKKPSGADKRVWDPTCVSFTAKEGYAQVKVAYAPTSSWQQTSMWVREDATVDDLKFTLQRRVGGHVSTYRLDDQRSGFPIPRDSPAVQDVTAYHEQQGDPGHESSAARVARSVVVMPSWGS